MENKLNKKRLIYAANYIAAFTAGLGLITGELWLFLVFIPAALFSHLNKSETRAEKDKLQDKSCWSFALGMFVPFVALIVFLFYFLYVMISRHPGTA